MNYLLFNAR